MAQSRARGTCSWLPLFAGHVMCTWNGVSNSRVDELLVKRPRGPMDNAERRS
uniref:Uncharacterized protein n=1 Tax=Hyaloperonospora arabidopsidis (strain Emoy2) TaxID=559515 RepID=M4B8V3_HYAAE